MVSEISERHLINYIAGNLFLKHDTQKSTLLAKNCKFDMFAIRKISYVSLDF